MYVFKLAHFWQVPSKYFGLNRASIINMFVYIYITDEIYFGVAEGSPMRFAQKCFRSIFSGFTYTSVS